MFLGILVLKFMKGILEYSGPLLIQQIIAYVSAEEKDKKKGIILVAAIIISRILLALLNARSEILLVKAFLSLCNKIP